MCMTAKHLLIPPGYELIFDLDWIGLQSSSSINRNAVYYFEVPVDPGEYALGSVDNGIGAYLLYLDISANQGDSVAVREKMTITTETYTVPKGVEFDSHPEKAFEIPITTTGNISFTVTYAGVNSSPTLDQQFTTSTKTIETVTVYDQLGSYVVRKVTQGEAISYFIGDTVESLADSTEAKCSSYFETSNNNAVILEYHYILEEGNEVENGSSQIYDLNTSPPVLTEYNVVPESTDQNVVATVDVYNSDKNYLKFMDRRDYQTGSTATISRRVQTP